MQPPSINLVLLEQQRFATFDLLSTSPFLSAVNAGMADRAWEAARPPCATWYKLPDTGAAEQIPLTASRDDDSTITS